MDPDVEQKYLEAYMLSTNVLPPHTRLHRVTLGSRCNAVQVYIGLHVYAFMCSETQTGTTENMVTEAATGRLTMYNVTQQACLVG